jgi:hypothetical protein
MNLSVTLRPRARLDILEQFLYLADHATVEVAERYFTRVLRVGQEMRPSPFAHFCPNVVFVLRRGA